MSQPQRLGDVVILAARLKELQDSRWLSPEERETVKDAAEWIAECAADCCASTCDRLTTADPEDDEDFLFGNEKPE